MKKKLLESLEKKALRLCVKALTKKTCDKTPRAKLIAMLEPYSYMEIVRTLNKEINT